MYYINGREGKLITCVQNISAKLCSTTSYRNLHLHKNTHLFIHSIIHSFVNQWIFAEYYSKYDIFVECMLSTWDRSVVGVGVGVCMCVKGSRYIFSVLESRTYCLFAAAAKSLQSCLTLCDPIDGNPPGSAVPGILQARTLEWLAITFSNAWKWKVKVKLLSNVQLLVTPWTAAYQAPLSMGFSRQEYWSGVPLPSPYCLFRESQILLLAYPLILSSSDIF